MVIRSRVCRTILIRRGLESSDPGLESSRRAAPNIFRHFGADMAACEVAGCHRVKTFNDQRTSWRLWNALICENNTQFWCEQFEDLFCLSDRITPESEDFLKKLLKQFYSFFDILVSKDVLLLFVTVSLACSVWRNAARLLTIYEILITEKISFQCRFLFYSDYFYKMF